MWKYVIFERNLFENTQKIMCERESQNRQSGNLIWNFFSEISQSALICERVNLEITVFRET